MQDARDGCATPAEGAWCRPGRRAPRASAVAAPCTGRGPAVSDAPPTRRHLCGTRCALRLARANCEPSAARFEVAQTAHLYCLQRAPTTGCATVTPVHNAIADPGSHLNRGHCSATEKVPKNRQFFGAPTQKTARAARRFRAQYKQKTRLNVSKDVTLAVTRVLDDIISWFLPPAPLARAAAATRRRRWRCRALPRFARAAASRRRRLHTTL